jgi:hypothetical protein
MATMAQAEGSFIRWQATTIVQFGYAVNLILTLATASLGFALNIVRDKHYTPTCWGKCFWMGSAVLLGVSIGLGIWCVLNRLCSFRKTTRNARDSEKIRTDTGLRNELESTLKQRRLDTKALDARTWLLLYWQIGSFGAGTLFLVASFVADFHAKLFWDATQMIRI